MSRPSANAVQTVKARRPEPAVALARTVSGFDDEELEDLIFSWRRVTDPKMRKIALGVIRSMAC